jgi:hypothetical protein
MECIDDSNNFFRTLNFSKKKSINSKNKTHHKSNNNKANNVSISKKHNNNSPNNSRNLKWLKQYVINKTSEIVNSNFEEFNKLFNIYNDSESELTYDTNETQIIPHKLKEQIDSYPPHFLWDENKIMIKEFISTPTCKNMNIIYNYKKLNGNIKLYYKSSEHIGNFISILLKIIYFYIKYTTINGGFQNKLPNITIYYSDQKKCLPINNGILGQLEINSGFTLLNEIILYRKQEIFKIIIHELQHFFRIDFGGNDMNLKIRSQIELLKKTYNVSSDRKNTFNPTESYAEVNATILNTIFATSPFTKESLIDNLFKEMLFSLYQTAKLLNYTNIESSHNIYKKHNKHKKFHQNSFAFEYHYLKCKLLFNYNQLLDFLRRKTPKKPLLLMKFPRDVLSSQDIFYNFAAELLVPENEEWNKALDIIMNLKPKDLNLKMTKLEIITYP